MVQANDPPRPGDPSIDEVLHALFRVVQRIKQTVHHDPVERQAVITLNRLRENGSIRLSDLASDLMVDLSTVSRQVRALEDHGLVVRSEDPEDGRAVRIELAPAGRDVLDQAWGRRHLWLAAALDGWTPEERASLAATLTSFADALAAAPPPSAADPAAHPSDPD